MTKILDVLIQLSNGTDLCFFFIWLLLFCSIVAILAYYTIIMYHISTSKPKGLKINLQYMYVFESIFVIFCLKMWVIQYNSQKNNEWQFLRKWFEPVGIWTPPKVAHTYSNDPFLPCRQETFGWTYFKRRRHLYDPNQREAMRKF